MTQSHVESYQDDLLTALDPLLAESEKLVGPALLNDCIKRPQSNCKESVSSSSCNGYKLWRSGSATISSTSFKENNTHKTALNYFKGSKSVMPLTSENKSDMHDSSSCMRRSTTSLYSASSRFAARYGDEDLPAQTKLRDHSPVRIINVNKSSSQLIPPHLRIPQAKNRVSIARSKTQFCRDQDQDISDKSLCLVTREYIDDLIKKLATTSRIDIGCNTLPLGSSFHTEITEKDMSHLQSQKEFLSKELFTERERVKASEQALDNLRAELSVKSNEILTLRQTCSQQEIHLEELETSIKRLVVEVANKEEENEEIINKLRHDCERLEAELNDALSQNVETQKRENLSRKKHEEIVKRLNDQIKQLEHELAVSLSNEKTLTAQLEKLQTQYNQLDAAKKEEKCNWYHQVSQWETHNKNEQQEKKLLMRKMEDLEKVNNNLNNSLSKLQEEYNCEVSSLRAEISNKEKESSIHSKQLENHLKAKLSEKFTKHVNELKSYHASQLHEVNEKAKQHLRNELESLSQLHAQEVERLNYEFSKLKDSFQQCENEKRQLHQEQELFQHERCKLLESMKSMMAVYCQEALQFLSRPVECPTENLINFNTPHSEIHRECIDQSLLEMNDLSSHQLPEELDCVWPPNSWQQ